MSAYESAVVRQKQKVELFRRLAENFAKRDELIREMKNSLVHDLLKTVCDEIATLNPDGTPFQVIHSRTSDTLTGCPRYRTHPTVPMRMGHHMDDEVEKWLEPTLPVIGFWVLERTHNDSKKMWFLTDNTARVLFISKSGRLFELPNDKSELLKLVGFWPTLTTVP